MEVKKLVAEKQPYIFDFQETKLAVCDDIVCLSMWGNTDQAYSY